MRKKILQEIHPLHLIREVQKWPVLYEKDGLERANVHLKNKMWLEVSKALFDDWDSYTKPVKELKVQELTRKWRNLRDTFKRHVELEKKSRECGVAVKKKKYVYFKYMLFLLPHLASAGDTPDEPLPELDEYFARPRRAPRTVRERTRPAPTPAPSPAPPAPPAPPAVTVTTVDDDCIDEDKHFLLSLVPTFKKMSDDEKLMAKMEILKVIREVRSRSRADSASEGGGGGEGHVKLEFYSVDDAHSQSNDSADSDRNSD